MLGPGEFFCFWTIERVPGPRPSMLWTPPFKTMDPAWRSTVLTTSFASKGNDWRLQLMYFIISAKKDKKKRSKSPITSKSGKVGGKSPEGGKKTLDTVSKASAARSDMSDNESEINIADYIPVVKQVQIGQYSTSWPYM